MPFDIAIIAEDKGKSNRVLQKLQEDPAQCL